MCYVKRWRKKPVKPNKSSDPGEQELGRGEQARELLLLITSVIYYSIVNSSVHASLELKLKISTNKTIKKKKFEAFTNRKSSKMDMALTLQV